MNPLLAAAVVSITAALVLYTIGVFGERRAGLLTGRHLGFFWAGFVFDTTGTTIMSRIAAADGGVGLQLHAFTGGLALGLMAAHAVWATAILVMRSARLREGFHRFSIVVWLVWLVPYVIGMLLGIPAIHLGQGATTGVALAVVALVALGIGIADARRTGAPVFGISKENLLIIASVVWMIAGLNVAILGIRAAVSLAGAAWWFALLLAVGGVAIFLAFHTMFGRIVTKNAARMRALPGDLQSPLRFLDLKGYLIMAVMMGGGFGLRAAGPVPGWFVAFFYTGLGIALALTGAGFLLHRARGEGWAFHASTRARLATA